MFPSQNDQRNEISRADKQQEVEDKLHTGHIPEQLGAAQVLRVNAVP